MTRPKTRPWLEISPGTVVANARALASRVAPSALCAVVKSNAYGHGLVPMGKSLSEASIPGLCLGVFTSAEAFDLRASGVKDPILVLGPQSEDEIARLVELEVACAVVDHDGVPYPRGATVHVKVDTGVGRFGSSMKTVAKTIERLVGNGVRIGGVYSHLANAEDLDERLSTLQLDRLLSVAAPDGAARHIAASAAAIMWPRMRLDMVRCGISVYGYWPSEAVRDADASRGLTLARALRWFAPVIQVRDIADGETVGYGCEYVASRPTTIAVLPLGYADGLPRAAGNGSLRVKFGEASAPIAGRVCMNACMLDVTDVRPRVTRGDVAELDVDEVARATDSIAYEVLARLPESLDRIYA